jgi:AraC-like DNA-binding protein
MTLTPLVQLLQNVIVPLVADKAQQRVIIARAAMKERDLPDGVQLERQKMRGKRVVVKSERLYANARARRAEWPAMNLHETSSLKLICVARGHAAYPVGNALLHVPPGFFIFVPPGVPHPDGSMPHLKNQRGHCELFQLVLYPGAVQCWSCLSENEAHVGDPHQNFLVRESQTVNLFRALACEVETTESADLKIIGALMTVCFQMLLRDLLTGRYLPLSPGLTREKPMRGQGEFADALYDYIRLQLHLPLTLESAAAHLFLSRAQFARRVKQETGKTFGEILTEQRVANAKTLLRESEWTVAIIAELVGFKSAAHFNHVFLRHAGSTPGQYRHGSRKIETISQGVRR